MDNAIHREDGVAFEDVPPGLIRKSIWGSNVNYECELCDGWYKDLQVMNVLAHIESAHDKPLGSVTVSSGILGPDGQPVQKEQPVPMFSTEVNDDGRGVIG